MAMTLNPPPAPTGMSAEMLIQRELRRTAAWVWGETGCFKTEDAADLLAQIHDRLEGISAAFREEIEEVWGV